MNMGQYYLPKEHNCLENAKALGTSTNDPYRDIEFTKICYISNDLDTTY